MVQFSGSRSIEDNCSLKDYIQPQLGIVVDFFKEIFELYPIESLKKIIITDNKFKNYEKSVQENSVSIDENINLTNDSNQGGAVVIYGYNEKRELEQYIFIRGDIFVGFCLFLNENLDEKFKIENQSLMYFSIEVVVHEIGHSIEYELIDGYFKKPIKKAYDLYNAQDKMMYEKYETMSLLSEYYAQRFMYLILKKMPHNIDSYENELINTIDNFDYSDNVVGYYSKAYRIIYWYLFLLAFHNENGTEFIITNTSNQNLDWYIKILNKIDNPINDLYLNFNKVNFENKIMEIQKVYKEIVDEIETDYECK